MKTFRRTAPWAAATLALTIAGAAWAEPVDAVTDEVVEIAGEEGYEQVTIRDRVAETEYELKNGTRSLIVVYDKLSQRMETEDGAVIEAGEHPGLKGIETALERHLRNAERQSLRADARAERRARRDEAKASRGNGGGNGRDKGDRGGRGNGNRNGGNGGGNGNSRK